MMTHPFSASMRHQRGLTLLEITVSLVLMGGVFLGLNTMIDRWTKDTVAATTGQQMRTLGDAATAYIKDNYTAVMGNATPTTPALITVATLQGANYLPAGFSVGNSYLQNQCVLVLEPVAGQLIGLVVTEGGTTIDDLTLGQIASVVGGSGGGIYSTATTTLQGTQNGWAQAVGNFANANHLNLKCDGATAGAVTLAAGHPVMALWLTGGDTTSGFLYRNAVTGRPELNRMNAGLDMNNNAITNAGTVGLTTVVTSGTACTTSGVVARDATGGVMSCVSGAWKAAGGGYWKDPVANYASLPAASNTVGDVRLTTDTSRAFSWTGAAWKALALDQLGRLITTGSTSNYGNLTVQGDGNNGWNGINFKYAGGTNAGTLMMHPSYSGFFNNTDNNWRILTDNVGNTTLGDGAGPAWNVMNGTLNPGWAVETWPCSPNGSIAKGAYTVASGWSYNGTILSCISGTWSRDPAAGCSAGYTYTGGACQAISTYAAPGLNSGAIGSFCQPGVYCNKTSYYTGICFVGGVSGYGTSIFWSGYYYTAMIGVNWYQCDNGVLWTS